MLIKLMSRRMRKEAPRLGLYRKNIDESEVGLSKSAFRRLSQDGRGLSLGELLDFKSAVAGCEKPLHISIFRFLLFALVRYVVEMAEMETGRICQRC